METFTTFLTDTKQRVVLNGQYSKWANIKPGVVQDSILGALLFLITIILSAKFSCSQ